VATDLNPLTDYESRRLWTFVELFERGGVTYTWDDVPGMVALAHRELAVLDDQAPEWKRERLLEMIGQLDEGL
jgi:hypothetical protein